jgi:hypothetical protein
MKFGTFLLAMVQPLLAKILVSLGFSVITIVGMNTVIDQLKSTLIGRVNSMPADMLNLALFAGIGTGIGIIFGACATKLMLWQIQNATSMLGKNPG